MAKNMFFVILTLYWATMGLQSWAITDVLEAQALRDLYRSLNKPMQLEHWKVEKGDPCEEQWIGVQCIGPSIIYLKLHGLGLSGNLGVELAALKNLKHLDLSSNNIEGSIPYSLPPNVTSLDLSHNRLSQSIPYSIEKMKNLRHLNLSHNSLSGSLGNLFDGLESLRLMDLSFNSFTGDLPTSFKSLKKLTCLFLQGNQFTGSVIFLSNLKLTDLNIEDNHFSGVIPENFQNILNLRIAGNKFVRETNYPPWKFPTPREQNSPADISAFEDHPFQIIEGSHKKKKPNAAEIVLIIGGITLVAAFSALVVFVYRQGSFLKRRKSSLGLGESWAAQIFGS